MFNLSTLKAAIQADAALTAFLAAGNHGAVADYYNTPAAGSIWRPSISVAELNNAIVWSEFAALSVQLQNTYLAMTAGGSVDATQARIRAGFAAVFSGVSLTNLTAMAQRAPSRFETLFTTANVCSAFGQSVTPADVAAALGA